MSLEYAYTRSIFENETDLDQNMVIWRYMNLERFIEVIEKNAVYFPSARKLINSDKFEGSISLGDLNKIVNVSELKGSDISILKKQWRDTWMNKVFEALLDLTFISCWHLSDFESYLMWKVYGNQKAIAIRTTVGAIVSSLGRYIIAGANYPEDLWYGQIRYIDFNSEETGSEMLGRFFYKRREFSSEAEFRLAVSLRLASEFTHIDNDDHLLVPLLNFNFIQDVYVSPFIEQQNEIEVILLNLFRRNNISVRLHKSCLIDFPIY